MRRLLTLMAVVLTILTGSLSTAFAQDGTPVAGDAGAVIIYGSDGQPAGEIVVDGVVDPFEDYDSSSAPQRGFHYVMASVTVTATEAAIDASPYSFSLVDTDGFVYTTTYLYRETEATEALPDFPGGVIEPGDSMSGAVFFQVLDGTTAGFVIYQPTYENMVTVADFRDATVEQGDTVEVLASDGKPAATITIDGVISPLEDYDSSYAPQRGFEYFGIQVTIENVGTGDFEVDAYDFVIVDTESFIYTSYGVYRPEEAEAELPSLQYNEALPAGDSVTGLVTFEVLAGTEPGLIYYAPGYDRQVRLAEYGEGQAPKPADTVPTRTTTGGDDEDETPEADKTPVSSADCDGVIEWAEESVPNINALFASFEVIGSAFAGEFDNLDADAIRDAADTLSDAAAAQADIDAPDIAADASEAFIDVLDQAASSLNDLADAVEANDTAAMADAVTDLTTLLSDESAGGMNDLFTQLSEDCPEIENVDIE